MLDKATIEILRAPFPEESFQAKKGFKNESTGDYEWLTGIKPQFVFERANDALGHDGWDFEVREHGVEGKEAWVWGRLTLYKVIETETDYKRVVMGIVDQFGTGNYNRGTSIGDALKGAATNSLEKCLSLKDVAHDAYKGKIPLPKDHPSAKTVNKTTEDKELEKAKKKLATLCKGAKINKKSFPTLVKTVLKEDKTIDELSVKEMNDLSTHVEKEKTPF